MATKEGIQKRWDDLHKLQEHYSDFRDFYADCSIDLLGFVPSDLQYDIANYVANGPMYAMVMAFRGAAKTTITGCYAIWCLIHDPTIRILILSAGSTMAKEISTWCIQILNTIPELECLRCDKSHQGARASVEAYDVHYILKGPDKSPSIKCMGITSNMQGSRADLLIADDIESAKNSLTEVMRENLRHLTLDFTSINQTGKILYLGTPQSVDSIYNNLPARGFDVRIWPGRYPTPDEMPAYGEHLAPFIAVPLAEDPTLATGGGTLGDRGKPTDPVMGDEETLTRKELDQGKAYFNLQFMLNTELTDEERFPLKLNNLMFHSFDLDECPGNFIWTNDKKFRIPLGSGSLIRGAAYSPAKVDEDYFFYGKRIISIDPSGASKQGDETGVSVLFECNGYIICMYNSGFLDSASPRTLKTICDICKKYKVHQCIVEKNMGAGVYTETLRGAFNEHNVKCGIEEVWSSGQKEMRIIDALLPVMDNHKLLFDTRCLEHDVLSTNKYPLERRQSYQLFFQLTKLTRDRQSLLHDD